MAGVSNSVLHLVRKDTQAVAINEQITRERVRVLEERLAGFVTMKWWQRIKWVLGG